MNISIKLGIFLLCLSLTSCATYQHKVLVDGYSLDIDKYSDDDIVPYTEARDYVENYSRISNNDRYSRTHLNWDEYKKHPLTKSALKQKRDSAGNVPKFWQSVGKAFWGKREGDKKLQRDISYSKVRKLKNAIRTAKVTVSRYYNLNNDEEVQLVFWFKVEESEDRYMVIDQGIERAEMLYWTNDGKEHRKTLELHNTTSDLYQYLPCKFHFSTTFKYRGKWYAFFATEENSFSVCKRIE